MEDVMGFLAIFPLGAAIAIKSKKKFEEVAMLPIFGVITVLYFSGVVSNFIPGLLICYAFILLSLIYCIYMFCVKKEAAIQYVFTPGMIALIIYIIYFVIISTGRASTANDDYKHWMLAVKNYYYYNDFSNIPISTDQYSSYHPAVTIWNYFSTKLWITCSTTFCFVAQDVFTVSLLLPLFKFVKGKNDWKKWFVIFMLVLVTPLSIGERVYQTLFVDNILGLVSAFILWNYYDYIRMGEKFNKIQILWGLFILGLVKEFGMVIGLVDVLIMISVDIYRKKRLGDKLKLASDNLIRLLFYAMGPLSWYLYLSISNNFYSLKTIEHSENISNLTWHGRTNHLMLIHFENNIEIERSFVLNQQLLTSHISSMIKSVSNIRNLHSPDFYEKVALSLWNSIFSTDSFGVGYLIKLSLYSLCIIVIFIFFARKIVLKPTSEKQHHDYCLGSALMFAIIAGVVLYCFALYLAYITLFAENEALETTTFARYISPYVYNIFVICIVIFINEQNGKCRWLYSALLIIILLFFDINKPIALLWNKEKPDIYWGIDDSGVTLKAEDKIYFVDIPTKPREHNMKARFRYRVMPADSNMSEENIEKEYGKAKDPSSVFTKALCSQDYDYIYIQSIDADKEFKEDFGCMFENEKDIGNDRLYKIENKGNDDVILQYCHY